MDKVIRTTGYITANITNVDTWEPTQVLRILKKEHSEVLQQKWWSRSNNKREWRDIPKVVEGSIEDKC